MGTRQSLRGGTITEAERNLVAQVVLDQPGEIKPSQVNGLAKALRRSKEAVKGMIEDAQDKLRANAEFYVDAHRNATQAALARGDAKSLAVAASASQWAMERISAEGSRIIEKAGSDSGNQGPRVMIGIKVGGLDATTTALAATKPVVDATITEIP